jgi:hypothetical protein
MNFTELLEGSAPKLPGAHRGVKIMTPQQFVSKSDDSSSEEVAEEAEQFFVLYVNGVAKTKYTTAKKAYETAIYLQTKMPKVKIDIKPETHHKAGMYEATRLPSRSRPFDDAELIAYLDRIRGKPDVDKKTGDVKLDKKSGKEKYISGKEKSDKYNLPYIHRNSVMGYYNEEGKKYDIDAIKTAIKKRPETLLKQNEKMKHSNGELEQFFNIGFAALTGIAMDEDTDKLIIVNTCPGAGSCKVDCFAMKGGKIQFQGPWLSDARILSFLLNDPEGFRTKLNDEIKAEAEDGKNGNYSVSIRWHDAGDFFSPEYLDLAFDIARANPDVKFYAYTKVAGAALADKPKNFIINWSEGASKEQERLVKANDPKLEKTKNSRIVPEDLFWDLLVKNKKGNLVKGPEGQWQIESDKLHILKHRLAKQYGIEAHSILSYDEYVNKPKSEDEKYNVIVAPGEGDISANDPMVISTLLLKH